MTWGLQREEEGVQGGEHHVSEGLGMCMRMYAWLSVCIHNMHVLVFPRIRLEHTCLYVYVC